MAQQEKMPAAKVKVLRSIPGIHMMKWENWLLQVVLWQPHVCTHPHTYMQANEQINKYNKI